MSNDDIMKQQKPGWRGAVNRLVIIVVAGCLLLSGQPVDAKKVFPSWDEKVFTEIERRHGEQASARLRRVYDLIIEYLNKPAIEQVDAVNDFMNNLSWIADPILWQQEDYWATPFETLTTFAGDCEDIAIAKYAALRLMGIPDDQLGFAYVYTEKKEPHMVLVYKSGPDQDSFILDNQHPEVVAAKKRPDLLAVYVFQNDGSLFLIKDDGHGNRSLKLKKEDRKFQKWVTAKDRAKKNRESLVKFNGGNPLIPDWSKDK